MKSVRPVFFGVLMFIAWIGAAQIGITGYLSHSDAGAPYRLTGYLHIILGVVPLFAAGVVAAWLSPFSWKRNSIIAGAICGTIIFAMASGGSDLRAIAFLILLAVGMILSFSGGAVARFFLRWMKGRSIPTRH